MPRFPKDTKKRFQRMRAAPAPDSDDDSSVDSRGNIRNLIDYDYSESESELFEMEDVPRRRAPRKAKTAAQKKIRKAIERAAAQSDASDASAPPKKSRKPTLVIASSDDETSEDERPVKTTKTAKAAGGAGAKAKSRRAPVVEYSDEDEEEEESESELSEVEESKKKRKPAQRRRKYVSESEEESDDDDSDDEEDESELDTEEDSEEEDDSEYDSEDEDEPKKRRGAIDIVISDLFGGGGGGKDPNKPKKYNLKKEPASVRRFVELVQKEDEGEEDTIDNDITYFKSLTKDKQSALLQVLEHKASPAEVQVPLKFKILEKVAVKPELNRIAMAKYTALCNLDPSSSEYYKCSHWISGFTTLPLGIYRDLPVKLEDGADKCHDFMSNVHKCMDRAIYGHEEPKLQIMQFVSSWIANPKAHGNVLSIHGPPGIGKTSLIKDGVAKALDRPFHFISLGGATDASYLDGHSYTYEGSTWGRIVEVLIQSKCMNPVIYFDELDKVSETPKGEEINNLLIHLTDGSQNDRFQDKYFTGIDLDLSRCLFIFSHNNIERVNPILRDRMYNIYCKGFSMKEKLLIAEEYLLPHALRESGLHEKISISKEILQHVIEHYTGGEAGVRELKRCLQTIVSKVNLLRFYNNPKQVPFAIEGFTLPFTVKKSHIDIFLKRKETIDESAAHMYI